MNVFTVLGDAAGAAAGGLAVYGGQLFFRQRSIVFRPGDETNGDPGSFGHEFEDVFLPLPDQTRIHAWSLPKDSGKLILFFPGGIGNLIHELHTLAFLVSFNVNVLAVAYPGFGKSEGRPSERGCYAAADSAWRYATETLSIVPSNILLFGRCLGAAVAARLASRHDCIGLVCHSAWTSVPDMAARSYPVLPARYFCYLRFNTLKYVNLCHCPILLLHADQDRVVPRSHSLRLFKKSHAPKQFLPLLGGHQGTAWLASRNLRPVFSALLNGEGRLWH